MLRGLDALSRLAAVLTTFPLLECEDVLPVLVLNALERARPAPADVSVAFRLSIRTGAERCTAQLCDRFVSGAAYGGAAVHAACVAESRSAMSAVLDRLSRQAEAYREVVIGEMRIAAAEGLLVALETLRVWYLAHGLPDADALWAELASTAAAHGQPEALSAVLGDLQGAARLDAAASALLPSISSGCVSCARMAAETIAMAGDAGEAYLPAVGAAVHAGCYGATSAQSEAAGNAIADAVAPAFFAHVHGADARAAVVEYAAAMALADE